MIYVALPAAYISGFRVFCHIFFPPWRWIMTLSAPWVASQDSAEALP